jgi:hypothetical protein
MQNPFPASQMTINQYMPGGTGDHNILTARRSISGSRIQIFFIAEEWSCFT